MKNIAFSGKMCSGKTTLASYLVGKYSYIKVSFADGVYKVAREVFDTLEKDRELLQEVGTTMRGIRRDVWIHLLKKNVLKRKMENFGSGIYTAGSNEPIDWIPFEPVNFVCDDCRFTNEVRALQDWGWLVVRLECPTEQRLERIERLYPGTPLNAHYHISEVELDTYGEFDYELDTGRPLNEVISDLDAIVQRYQNEKVRDMYKEKG